MRNNPYEGSERRTYFRISYQPEKRPKLVIGKHEFDIVDISESGIRFVNNKKIGVKKKVLGKATFLNGESVIVEGNIVWEQNGEFGLLLKHVIPSATMEREKKYVILNDSKK